MKKLLLLFLFLCSLEVAQAQPGILKMLVFIHMKVMRRLLQLQFHQ